MELKWALAIGFELAFWLMLAAFLVLRYRYRVEGVTRLFVVGVVLDTAGIVALGVWDFAETGTVGVYTAFIAAWANVAEEEGAVALSVGTEMNAVQGRDAEWRGVIAAARRHFGGALTYSANWDAYQAVPFWDALDAIGKARLFLHGRLMHGLKLLVAMLLGTLLIAGICIAVVLPVTLLLVALIPVLRTFPLILLGGLLLLPVIYVSAAMTGTLRSSIWTIGYLTQVES